MVDAFLRKALYSRHNTEFNTALNYYCDKDYANAIPILLKCRTSNAMYLLAKYNYGRDYENMLKYINLSMQNSYSQCLLADYYRCIKKDYTLAKEYYTKSIKHKNVIAMNNLGFYYKNIEKNYDLMKKYYLMAIELGYYESMNNLGYYYQFIEIDYDQMKKYYFMAIEFGNSSPMTRLGYYYKFIEKDYEQMKKYYLIAIKLKNPTAMNNLGKYYEKIENDYDKMKQYYLMAIEFGCVAAMYNLGLHYSDMQDIELSEKYLIMALNAGLTKAFNKLINIVSEAGIPQLFRKYNVDASKFGRLEQYKYFGLGAISDECGICCMTCDLILMPRCTHRLCAECYTKVKQCPYCRA